MSDLAMEARLAELEVLARTAVKANEQIRGPYTLGTNLFGELTSQCLAFRAAASPDLFLALMAERDALKADLDHHFAVAAEQSRAKYES